MVHIPFHETIMKAAASFHLFVWSRCHCDAKPWNSIKRRMESSFAWWHKSMHVLNYARDCCYALYRTIYAFCFPHVSCSEHSSWLPLLYLHSKNMRFIITFKMANVRMSMLKHFFMCVYIYYFFPKELSLCNFLFHVWFVYRLSWC